MRHVDAEDATSVAAAKPSRTADFRLSTSDDITGRLLCDFRSVLKSVLCGEQQVSSGVAAAREIEWIDGRVDECPVVSLVVDSNSRHTSVLVTLLKG